jgi:probable HAF family extracellular repeat protein
MPRLRLVLGLVAVLATHLTATSVAAAPIFMGLGDLGGGPISSSAHGVSADGSVVVGRGNGASDGEAFRWTAGAGMLGLGDLPGGTFESQASGVSAYGSVVVGNSRSASGNEAFRWTAGGGMVGLGDLPGGIFSSRAWAVSADGSVVVGFSRTDLGNEAFRWTVESGMVGLGDLPGGVFSSVATAISADGQTIVGMSSSAASGSEAFRWTAASGMEALGFPPGRTISRARAVSGDGSIVVGESLGGPTAFIWDEENGMRLLSEVLTDDYGIDLTGWSLELADGISSDGRTIVGRGTNPSGFTEAWVAVIPEPSTALLLAFGLLGLGVAGRRPGL